MAQSRQQGSGRRRVNLHLEILEDHTPQVQEAIRRLSGLAVMIGIPSDREQPHHNESAGGNPAPNAREPDPDDPTSRVNNADLGYIHEHGAPAANIPPRPWLRPGVVNSRSQWENYLRQAGKAAFEGKPDIMDRALHAAGIAAVSAVKNRITQGIPPPLSEVTVARRRARTPSRQARTSADTTALVDTAQFLNSISYVVRHNDGGEEEGNV